jgi:predicted PurR-regulated permease PerM
MTTKNLTINISTASILKVLAFLLIVLFIYLVHNVVVLVFASFLLASAFNPMVDWLHRHKIPRILGILIIYVVLLAVVTSAVVLIAPPIAKEVSQLAVNLPDYYQQTMEGLNHWVSNLDGNKQQSLNDSLNSLSNSLPKTITNVFVWIGGLFGGLFSVVLVLVLTFYFMIEEEATKRFIQSVAPVRYHVYLMETLGKIQIKLGYWLRGQALLSVTIFAFTFVGLSLLGVPYALVLAFIAGLLEIIPVIGPTIAAVPAIFFAFLVSPWLGVSTIILYIVVQQVENNLLTPKIMGKSVGLNALVVIIAVLIGAQIAGIFGALFAVPVTAAASVIFNDFINKKNENVTEE